MNRRPDRALLALSLAGALLLSACGQRPAASSARRPAPAVAQDRTEESPAPAVEPLMVRIPSGATAPRAAMPARQPAAADAHAEFVAWLRAGHPDLARGTALATARRARLHELIRTDPEAALAQRLAWRERQAVPVALRPLLEEPIADDARLITLAKLEAEDGLPLEQVAALDDGRTLRNHTYGRRAGKVSQAPVPVWGIAIGDDAALSERPSRPLDPGEPVDPTRVANDSCPVSGDAADGPALVVGKRIVRICHAGHIEAANAEFAEAEVLTEAAVLASPWTTGRKTLLWVVAAFKDQSNPPTITGGENCIAGVSTFLSRISFGAFEGFEATVIAVTLPKTAAEYGASYYAVKSDAMAAAAAAGHVYTTFNHHCVRYSGGPGDFSGSAFVGTAGTWMKTDSVGVGAHEFGHNLGLYHANYWTARGDTVVGPGSSNEYGNSFDTMGSADAGNKDFNASSKWRLDWLPDTSIHTAAAGGTYRIYAMDDAALLGAERKQALRIPITKLIGTASVNYWLEYRARPTSNRWLSNGLVFKCLGVGSSSGQDWLFDTTPGTADGKNDAAITFGRTFSDREVGVHVTPLGFAGTTPQAIDVRLEIGTFPGNRAPVITGLTGPTLLATSQAGAFAVSASDPDGDALAWWWQFGDGSLAPNAAAATKSWSGAGEYPVRVVVSDRKGGTASRTLLVQVGTPSTYSVRGTIRDGQGLPVADVRVHNGASGGSARVGWSDSDGTYAIGSLPAGTVTISAIKPGWASFTPDFTNPLTLGPSTTGKDFTAVPVPTVTVVASDATASEGGDTGAWTITRTGSTAAALTVKLSFTGLAAFTTDYTVSPNSSTQIVIPAGSASAVMTLTAKTDDIDEGDENATLRLVPEIDYAIGTAGRASVVIRGATGPANDHFANRQTLTGATPVVDGTTRYATFEDPEPAHGTSANAVSVWYTWTAPASGACTATISNVAYSYLTDVYTGTQLGNLAPVVSKQNAAAGFTAVAGTTYHIAVSAMFHTNTGPFRLSLETTAAPAITAQPAGVTVVVGQTATFSVGASGVPAPTFQWQRQESNASAWTAINGATAATYATTAALADNGAKFRAVATNSVGSATSGAATLTVTSGNAAPTIAAIANLAVAEDTPTAAIAVTIGDVETAASALTLSAASSNTTLLPVANVVLGGSGGERTATLTPAANRNGTVTVTLTVSDGALTASRSFVLTVNAVNDLPVNTVVPALTGTAKVGQTLTATSGTWNDSADAGTIASYAYQWQRADSTAGANLADIAGATAATYVPVDADLGKVVRVRVTATDAGTPTPAASASATSAWTVAVAAAEAAPAITGQPTDVTVVAGQSATFSVARSGTPTPSLQWQRQNAGGSTWTAITGATSATYSLTTVLADSGAKFRAIATNSAGTATSAAATLTVSPSSALPTGWTAADVGSTGLVGSATSQGATADGETMTITGSGTDIWGANDAFQYASTTLTGDGAIIARVASQTATNSWAKAGLMLRDDLATGSRHAAVFATPSNGVAFQRRTTTGGASSHTAGSRTTGPVWLKLERVGTTITAFESADGTTWKQIGTTTWAMGATLRVGLAVTAHDNSRLSTARFESVRIIGGGGAG